MPTGGFKCFLLYGKRSSFDHVLRSSESYNEKWEYVPKSDASKID